MVGVKRMQGGVHMATARLGCKKTLLRKMKGLAIVVHHHHGLTEICQKNLKLLGGIEGVLCRPACN